MSKFWATHRLTVSFTFSISWRQAGRAFSTRLLLEAIRCPSRRISMSGCRERRPCRPETQSRVHRGSARYVAASPWGEARGLAKSAKLPFCLMSHQLNHARMIYRKHQWCNIYPPKPYCLLTIKVRCAKQITECLLSCSLPKYSDPLLRCTNENCVKSIISTPPNTNMPLSAEIPHNVMTANATPPILPPQRTLRNLGASSSLKYLLWKWSPTRKSWDLPNSDKGNHSHNDKRKQ